MWIFIGLAIIFVLSLVLTCINDTAIRFATTTLTGIAVFLLSITIPLYHAEVYYQLAKRPALQQSFDTLRTHPFGPAYAGGEIVKWNAWLASAKYWRNTQWATWWPSEIDTVQPIE
jgi:hypothetical protein